MEVHLEPITLHSLWMRVGQGKQAIFRRYLKRYELFFLLWYNFITLNVILEIFNIKQNQLLKFKSFYV